MSTTTSKTVFHILFAIAFAHLLNDLIQAVVPAMYPQLEQRYGLSMTQVGMITFCFQLAASIFQPLVGAYTDKHPQPYSQVVGMLFSSAGVILLAYSPNYYWILVSVVLIGTGSSIFHPEASRVAYFSAGDRRSLAQSIFQIGGNTGTALGPLFVVWFVLPNGQKHLLWVLVIAFAAKVILLYIAGWRKKMIKTLQSQPKKEVVLPNISKKTTQISIVILLVLIFSKYFYTAGITSYFQFYLIQKFQVTEVQAQIYLFYFLIAAAVGTLLGGAFGDKFGRKYVIWFSILGVAPMTLALPYVSLEMTGVLIVMIGLVLSSAFPAILVYAQELLPRKLGMVSGLFYGFAFGMGGLGSALLGILADHTSITYVYHITSFLPLIGLAAFFLPNLQKQRKSIDV